MENLQKNIFGENAKELYECLNFEIIQCQVNMFVGAVFKALWSQIE